MVLTLVAARRNPPALTVDLDGERHTLRWASMAELVDIVRERRELTAVDRAVFALIRRVRATDPTFANVAALVGRSWTIRDVEAIDA